MTFTGTLAPIDKAQCWHTYTSTPDYYNSAYTLAPGIDPHGGEGHARFGVFNTTNSTNDVESFYGETSTNLISGQEYLFNVFARTQEFSFDVGINVHILNYIPSNLTALNSIAPTLKFNINEGNTYKNYSGCFSINESDNYYVFLSFYNPSTGNFSYPTTGNTTVFIDDLSIITKQVGSIDPVSVVNGQNEYCFGSPVIIDGSASTDYTSYNWELYIVTGSEHLIYSGDTQITPIGSFNVDNIFNIIGHNPQPGNCYRVYLTTYNGCSDREYIDFCYLNPDVNFLNGSTPLCEGVPVDLSVTGDNGWTYSWSTGQSGVGLKTISVTPTGTTVTYSVTVTTPLPLGCTHTETKVFTVQSSSNIAPWMDGINGSNEYVMYAHAGDNISFTSHVYNDHTNELIIYDLLPTNIPSYFSNFTNPTAWNGQTLGFTWNTGGGFVLDVPPGAYSFTVLLDDNNSCNDIDPVYYTFTINILCDLCPICIDFEDRGPVSPQIPLPPETKAGKCIQAGLAQSVETGTSNVLFQAGDYIELGPFFTAGPGFTAQIESTTCVTDCEDCCTDWTGFRIDDIPNDFYINFEDDDPMNDFFQFTDVEHPFCAFGAKGFHFQVSDGNLSQPFYESSVNSNSCCTLESPAPENQIAHSSIWWDGYRDNFWGNPVQAPVGSYYFILTLYGCDGQVAEYTGHISVMNDPSGIVVAPTTYEGMSEEQIEVMIASIEEYNRLTLEINLSPNPANDYISIIGINQGKDFRAQLFDDKGIMIEKDLKMKNNQFNVSTLSSGTYYCKLLIDGQLITKKFVKL